MTELNMLPDLLKALGTHILKTPDGDCVHYRIVGNMEGTPVFFAVSVAKSGKMTGLAGLAAAPVLADSAVQRYVREKIINYPECRIPNNEGDFRSLMQFPEQPIAASHLREKVIPRGTDIVPTARAGVMGTSANFGVPNGAT